jgi:hypothetical protein
MIDYMVKYHGEFFENLSEICWQEKKKLFLSLPKYFSKNIS